MHAGTDTWMPSYVVLSFGDDPNVLSSSAIPTDPTTLNLFPVRSINLQFQRLDSNGVPVSAYSGFVWANDVTVSPVPLPAAAWLLLSGLAGMGLVGRRRKAA
jgi:hypothetical protein